MKQPFRNQKLGKIVSRTIKNRPSAAYEQPKRTKDRIRSTPPPKPPKKQPGGK